MLVLCPQGSISNVRQLTRQANAVNVVNGKTSACWHRRCGSRMVDHDAVLHRPQRTRAGSRTFTIMLLHPATAHLEIWNIVVDWMMIGWLVSRWCPCIRQNRSSSVWIYFLVMTQSGVVGRMFFIIQAAIPQVATGQKHKPGWAAVSCPGYIHVAWLLWAC